MARTTKKSTLTEDVEAAEKVLSGLITGAVAKKFKEEDEKKVNRVKAAFKMVFKLTKGMVTKDAIEAAIEEIEESSQECKTLFFPLNLALPAALSLLKWQLEEQFAYILKPSSEGDDK